jgi:aryl-alcohol dehydrogenase-like predicted oxidoreductase
MAHPRVTPVMPGTNSPDQVRQNMDAFTQTIPGAFCLVGRNRETDLAVTV